MTDKFADRQAGLDSPGSNAFDITGDDSNDLAASTRGLFCTGDGAARVTFVDMDDGTFIDLPALNAGALYPFRVKRVWATNTTAVLIGVL